MVFLGLCPTPHKGLSPLDPVSAKRSQVFQTDDSVASSDTNTVFLANRITPRLERTSSFFFFGFDFRGLSCQYDRRILQDHSFTRLQRPKRRIHKHDGPHRSMTMYRLRFYPIPLALTCFLWLTSFSGCGVVQECITGKDCPVKYTCQNGTCIAQADPCAATGGTSCGSACVDLRTNNDHCGACATKCGIGSNCQNGQCKAVTKPCQSNAECPTGQVCQNGQCQASCQAGQTLCGSLCVDLQTNNDHCGACGQKCGIGAGCKAGSCKPVVPPCTSDAECPTDQVCQNGQCKAIAKPVCVFGQDQTCNHRLEMSALAGTCLKDGTCQCNANFVKNQSSGKCDIACKASTEICNGLDDDCDGVIDNGCQCAVGTVRCGDACVSLTTDVNHCGACGLKCPQGKSCENGSCFECAAGGTVCAGACVILTKDLNHCGACGNSCRNGRICRNSACICEVDRTLCGDACVDTSTDNDHCGACGQKCGIGTGCKAGSCKPVVPPPCASNADCAAGQVCSNGQCQPHVAPCTSNANCAAGQVCSNGQCQPHVAPCTSNANCAAGQVCLNGQCQPHVTPCASDMDCAAGQFCQNGQCK